MRIYDSFTDHFDICTDRKVLNNSLSDWLWLRPDTAAVEIELIYSETICQRQTQSSSPIVAPEYGQWKWLNIRIKKQMFWLHLVLIKFHTFTNEE